ncbi:MAG: ATP-dependent DNA helicase RecG [Bacillota bacterium]
MNKKIPNSVQFVKGVGPKGAELLANLDLYTVNELLNFFPRDYEDRSKLTRIANARAGESVTIKAQVQKIKNIKVRKGLSIFKVFFSDNSGSLSVIWYNQDYLRNIFKKGKVFFIHGEIDNESWRKYRKKEINNAVYEKANKEELIHTNRVVPIYHLTNGLSQKRIRKIIFHALKDYAVHLDDLLPNYIKNKYNFISYAESLWGLHFPESRKHYIKAYKRLAFEEFFLLQLQILEHKKGEISKNGIKHKESEKNINDFIASLPFDLTSAQKKVWQEIKKDMESFKAMQRLLQGDVGSGKTVVAALSLIEAVSNGYQGVFMAPTEILAEQHFLRLKEIFSEFDFNILLLSGSLTEKKRAENLKKIKENKADIIVGTHALFQEDIEYAKLSLIIIDEQHRFGVEQRYKMKEKGENPDLLVMTATPIPRSLALTIYGDLEVSTIDELPPGRKKVKTFWRKTNKKDEVYSFVKEEITKGRQAYIVCPLIEPSEELEAVSALEIKDQLENTYFKDFKVELLHSKIKKDEKKKIMKKFRSGKIDVLVSTTVIEVGVDVANASIMVIENAERFGLAQLHQLRGRVGRGKYQSYCILISDPNTADSIERLKVMTRTEDGFEIAEKDLEIRGPGEFFGTKQHGIPDLKVANLLKDQKLLNMARNEAQNLIAKNNWYKDFPKLKEKINELELKL